MSPDTEPRRTYRIAMVAAKPFPVPQGSQVLVLQTADLLQARGHEVHLVVYGYGLGDAPPGLHLHRAANVPGPRKTLAGPSWAKPLQDMAMVRALRAVLRDHPIDIVHAHNYEGLLVALLAGKRPIVYHAHTCLRDELPHFLSPALLSRPIGGLMDTALPHRADAIVALHDRAREYLIAHGCREKDVVVVPPPVDPGMVLPIVVRDELPKIVYAGNLDAYQNLDLLRVAMAIVRAKEPRARLHIATADPRSCPGADSRIEVRTVHDLQRVFGDDIVVACPRVSWSGYPIKLLNAMAAGKPIVACKSAAYGLSHRDTALIVPDNDARAFADALLELLRTPTLRRRLGETAQNAAKTTLAPATIAARIECVYANVST